MKIPRIFKINQTPSSNKNIDEEMGASGDAVFGSLDNELQRKDKLTIKKYREMRDEDATVAALFNVVTLPILATTFGVKASEDDENEEQAEFIRTCLFKQPYLGGMEVPFSLVLEQMLHAVMDGFEVFERVYKLDDSGKIVLGKLALRDATTIKIRVNQSGGYDGIRQQASFGERQVDVQIPAYKTFLFTYGKADDAWYGRSAFRSCYRNFDKKRKLEYLDSISIQNSAIRPKVMTRTENTAINGNEDGDKGLKELGKLGRLKAAIKLPFGFDVKELTGGDNSKINESIERQNSEMARSFLATFLLLGSQGTNSTGSYALSTNQSDFFMIALKGTMNLIVDHINQYWIADLIDLNYPVGKRHYPEFYFDDLTDETKDFLKSIFAKLIEKDKISDDVIGGIEEQIKSRFEIEPVERETPTEQPTGQNPDNSTSVENDLSGHLPDKVENKSAELEKTAESLNKEGSGSDAGKFRRQATVWEEKVNWGSLEKKRAKVENGFADEATPILDNFIKKISSTPDEYDNKLPDDYVKCIRKYYGIAYNYGKMAASDEEGKPAPKTKDDETKKTQEFVDFIVDRQTEDIAELIKNADDEQTVAEFSAAIFLKASAEWIKQAVNGTKTAIFGSGNNAGRKAAYGVFDKEEDATYMWSALMENSCAICESLDGSVYSSEEMQSLKYQPGEVHLNCACEWVRMTGDARPKPTGLPDNIDELDHIANTKKAVLEKEGLVKNGETKKNALERGQFSNADHGSTLKEVEDGIRDKDVEFFAGFDKTGAKLCEITNNSDDSVKISPALDYLRENNISMFTHNHPHNSAFSFDDLYTAALLDVDEARAVSALYDYSMKPKENGWPEAILIPKEDRLALWEQYEQDARALLNLLAKNNPDLAKMDDDARWLWITNEVNAAFADDYNLLYNRTER